MKSSVEEIKRKYNDLIEKKKRGYEITAAIVGYTVQKMQEAGIISNNVSITGRIKSFKSAYDNVGKKTVDDCFGLRIVADEKDIIRIMEQLSKIFVVDTTKDHRKKKNTPYNAIHQMLHLQKEYIARHGLDGEILPEVEVQYWNEEIEQQCLNGELSYCKYKHKNLISILNRLDVDPEGVYSELPICYEVRGNNVRVLSDEETFDKIYPEIRNMRDSRRVSVGPDIGD